MAGRHYVLFPDVENAKQLYSRMKEAGIRSTLAPTPREADRCCGLAVLFYEEDDRGVIKELIAIAGVKILRFYDGSEGDPNRMKFC